MATFALIHGAGDVGWYWHLGERELRDRGHDVIAPDLPIDDNSSSFGDYADTIVDAAGHRPDGPIVVAGMSFGGYTAPIVCDCLPAAHFVLVSPMIPRPGESAEQMFANTGYEQEPQEGASDLALFYHDIPEDLGKEALSRGRYQSGTTWNEPWPLAAWPEVPVTCVISRSDRLFPASWLRKVAADRLGATLLEIESGHSWRLAAPPRSPVSSKAPSPPDAWLRLWSPLASGPAGRLLADSGRPRARLSPAASRSDRTWPFS